MTYLHKSDLLSYILSCLRVLCACISLYFACLRARKPLSFTYQLFSFFSIYLPKCLCLFSQLHAKIAYVPTCLRACVYLPLCFKNVYAYNYEDVYVQLASYIPLINYMSSRDKKTRIQLEGMVVAQRTLIIIVLFSFSTTIWYTSKQNKRYKFMDFDQSKYSKITKSVSNELNT